MMSGIEREIERFLRSPCSRVSIMFLHFQNGLGHCPGFIAKIRVTKNSGSAGGAACTMTSTSERHSFAPMAWRDHV